MVNRSSSSNKLSLHAWTLPGLDICIVCVNPATMQARKLIGAPAHVFACRNTKYKSFAQPCR